MKRIALFALAASMLCGQNSSDQSTDAVVIRGPQFHSPRFSDEFEEFASPRITRFREEYRPDDVVRGEISEFQ
jgi:hypothetical protein